MWRKFAVLVLVLAMCPAASELLEVGIHLVRYGDDAHAHADGDDHGEGSPNDEHGCSELFHLCACHTTVTPVLHQHVVALSDAPLTLQTCFHVDDAPGREDPEPPVRPPISALV